MKRHLVILYIHYNTINAFHYVMYLVKITIAFFLFTNAINKFSFQEFKFFYSSVPVI